MVPILVSIPHCSFRVGKKLRKAMALTDKEIKNYSDLYTDELYNFSNFPTVKSKISRLVVDLNRAPDDIITICHLSDDGVIVQVTEDGTPIYHDNMTPTEADISQRLSTYHERYHQEIDEKKQDCVFLVDGHSYRSVGPKTKDDAGAERADICLGNRHYTTCSYKQTHYLKRQFEKLGYSVSINKPYDGRYIMSYHCHRDRLPGIQIEISRKLYMNEKTLQRRPKDIATLNEQLQTVLKEFYEHFKEELEG